MSNSREGSDILLWCSKVIGIDLYGFGDIVDSSEDIVQNCRG